jgi:hypothetical protein
LTVALLINTCSCSPTDERPGIDSSSRESKPEEATVSVEDVEPAALLESLPFDSTTHGALHGVVRVTGKVPARFPIGARKKSECCAFEDVKHMSDIVVAHEGKLKYAYVSVLAGYDPKDIPKASKDPVFVDQRGCIYTPHVAAMQVGQKLLIGTSDPTVHNVNLSAPDNGQMKNQAMLRAPQDPLEFEFRRPESVKLRCDIHPWMSGLVHVSKHPWFAVSDEAGAFSIPNLPPGQYVIEVQHEEFGNLRGSVTIEANQSTGVAFEFDLD